SAETGLGRCAPAASLTPSWGFGRDEKGGLHLVEKGQNVCPARLPFLAFTLVSLLTPLKELIVSERPHDLCYLSALDLAARIRARKVSPVEAVEAVAERIKRLNPRLNAFVTLDLANARKDAEMKHKMRQEHPDGDLGPLHGVPVAIKDDLEVAGLRFTCG